MIIEHRTIEREQRVMFETVVTDSPETLTFCLKDEAYFIHVRHGHHISITPSEVVEVSEGNLAFSVGENLILKAFPNEEEMYQVTIIHVGREAVLDTFANKFPELTASRGREVSHDMVTGKPCIVTQHYIEGILHYFNNRHIITDDIIDLKVREILHLLLRSQKAEQVAALLEGFVNKETTSFKHTIENHLLHDISLSELAHLCNMSLSTFKRHFKKIYLTTPTDYLYGRRLEHSQKLLATSEQSVVDVAHHSGFKSVSHYSRKFKERYGISPTDYRLTRSGK